LVRLDGADRTGRSRGNVLHGARGHHRAARIGDLRGESLQFPAAPHAYPDSSPPDRVKVLHVAPSVDPSRGGPARSIPALTAALRDAGVDARLAAAGVRGDGNYALSHWPVRGEIPDARSRATLDDAISAADLVEIHSLWNGTTSMTAAICRRRQVPYLLTPRG